jgi:type I restriction enzyme S subunit
MPASDLDRGLRMSESLMPYPAYRDSGVAWLGDVPTDWEVDRLKNHISNILDQTSTCQPDELYLALEHVESWTGRLKIPAEEPEFESLVKRFRYNDILFGKLRPYLAKVVRPQQSGVCVGEFLVLRPKTVKILADYLEYLLRSVPFIDLINSSTYGAKMPRADWMFIGNVQIPLPPFVEQSAIVRFLDHADRRLRRAVRAKRQLIALLNEQKQAIIHRAVTRGLDPDVPLKDSGVEWLGEVPAHWEITQLRRRWEVIDCKHLTVPFVEEGTPLASVRETQCFDLDLSNANRTTEEWYKHLVSGDRKPKRGDIIYCRNVCVGASAFVCGDEKFAMGQDVCLIRSISENGRFLNNFLHSEAMRQQLSLIQIGSTFNRINVSEIKSLLVVIPPRDEQDRIVFSIDASTAEISRVIAATQREIDLLLEFRTRLIADVVTGKLDVREAAAGLPDEANEPALFDEVEVLDENEDSDMEEEADE